MFTEAKKIQIIEDLLKTTNDATLMQVQAVLKKAAKKRDLKPKSAYDFSGIWSNKEVQLMEKAIAEGCEQIDPHDWK
jgi:hypothetical protein